MDANSEIMQDHFVVDRDHVCKLHENYRTLIIHRKDVIDLVNSGILQDMKISRMMKETGIRLCFRDGRPTAQLIYKTNGIWNTVDPEFSSCDYIIHEGVLLPLDIELTYEVLRNAGVDESGMIDLRQYAKIRGCQIHNSDLTILDEVGKTLSDHPICKMDSVANLRADLYDYQKTGVGWLNFIAEMHGGCILGDEMGLGKTLQIIALLASESCESDRPSLIVAPASLLENWRREFERFTSGVDVCIHHGSSRTGNYRNLENHDIIITSYGTLISDLSVFTMIEWNVLVLDEAQYIKNRNSERSRYVKTLNRQTSIAVTGTPFENHMSDLWSITDFILPGYLGSASDFELLFEDDNHGAMDLEPLITPIMLRRRVADVADDLPPRIEIPIPICMGSEEAKDYEKLRKEISNRLDSHDVSGLMIQKLRMYCTHPSLVDKNSRTASEKFSLLVDLLEELCEIGDKIIIFTSFNDTFPLIRNVVEDQLNIPCFMINGSVKIEERQSIIDEFSSTSGSAVMILNPRAAGVGLNITAASRVIHYNLEWNPAIEDQASARAYRRGQTKTVFIYRLYYKDTVEELMNERLEMKRDLFDKVIKGTDGSLDDAEDIIRAISMSPCRM